MRRAGSLIIPSPESISEGIQEAENWANAEPVIEVRVMSDGDRLLTEVDHLVGARAEDGTFDPAVCEAVHQNLTTSIQEQAMPSAVTETRHEAKYDLDRKEMIFRVIGQNVEVFA